MKIEELAIIAPKGIKISGENCKPAPFKDYTKENCYQSCKKTCKETCEEHADTNKKKECEDGCDLGYPTDLSVKCTDECDILFKDEAGASDYTGYQLDVKSEKLKERKGVFEEIGRFTQFGCRLMLEPDVLELNVPITTKFIRARAKYKYLVESTYSVPVEPVPGPAVYQDVEGAVQSALQISPEFLRIDEKTIIPLSLIRGLVSLESQGIHCCKQNIVGFKGCKPDFQTTRCTDKILKSTRGSIGIMQINNQQPESITRNERILTKLINNGLCNPNEDIYDRNCNIYMGLEILKENYQKYKNGHPNPQQLQRTCQPGQKFYNSKLGRDVDLYQLYSSYKDFDAVLRAYNGWGCNVEFLKTVVPGGCNEACNAKKDFSRCVQLCIEYTVFYVDHVKDRAERIGKDPRLDPLPDLLPKTEGSEEVPLEGG